MVGLKKFMRQYKSDDNNPQIPDEEITFDDTEKEE